MPNVIFSHGVTVLLCGAEASPDPCFTGIVFDRESDVYTWEAFPKPTEYYITFSKPGGSVRGSYTGSTFNLGLEVSQGFRHTILGG